MRADKEPKFEWTAERVEQFKAYAAQGLSYSQIGAMFGVSRNAAIGKGHRLGLTEKRVWLPKPKPETARKAKKHPTRPVVVPRERGAAEREGTKAPWRGKADFNGGVPLEIGSSMKFLAGDAWDALPGSAPVPLEAHRTGCRWPIGDPLQPGFGFCNEATEGKSVYCALHSRRAYTVGA